MAEETFKEDAFYLVKITDEEKEAEHEERDTWGTVVLTGQKHIKGFFLQRRMDRSFELINGKKAIFFRESVVWPQVFLEAKKKHFTLQIDEQSRINMAIDNSMAYTPY